MPTSAPDSGRFGNYELVQLPGGGPVELGRGGFGRTYHARHCFLGTDVALKVIADRLAFDDAARAKFLQEAREHVRLDHPGIARIIEFGEKDGAFFYSMDLCPDGDLKEFVRKRGPLPPPEAMHLILQTAEALRYVHECGILHLDIKPSNLLVILPAQGPPRVKITDFGLVKRMAGADPPPGEPEAATSWSPAFASPEQIREWPLDERTDIFSLGMTAWFLMTGQMSVEGTSSEVIEERLSETSCEPLLPVGLVGTLRGIVARMIEKDAARRYRSCAELIGEIQTALGSGTPLPAPTARRLKEHFRLEPSGRNFTGEVFRGREIRSGTPVRVTVVHPGHGAAQVQRLREHGERLASARPPGLVPLLEVAEFAEGWAVVEQEIAGVPLLSILRREGAVAFKSAAGLMRDAAAAIDTATACGFVPAPLEVALLEGVPGDGSVNWTDVRIQFALQWITPPPDWTAGAEMTTLPVPSSPVKLFAGLVYQILSARQVRSASLHSSAACPPIPGLGSEGNHLLAACLAGEVDYPNCDSILAALMVSESLSAAQMERHTAETTTRPRTAPPGTPAPSPVAEPVVHVLTPAAEPRTAPLSRSAVRRTAAILVALFAAAGLTWLLWPKPPVPAGTVPTAPAGIAVKTDVLPATIRVRSFQSRVPLPPALTIGGRTGTLEGNTLVFDHAAAADGTFLPDSPRWELAGRPVRVDETTFEAKLQIVTQPVALKSPSGTTPPWTAVTFTPESAADLPDPAKLVALLGAQPDSGGGMQFALTFPDPPSVTLPPGSYRVSWTSAAKTRSGAPLTVEAGKSATVDVPAVLTDP